MEEIKDGINVAERSIYTSLCKYLLEIRLSFPTQIFLLKWDENISQYGIVHVLAHVYSINHNVLVGENLSGREIRVELDK